MAAPPQASVNWKDLWDIVAHIGTVIGLLATGVWAYFNFVKSRRYYPRLEMDVSGEIREASDRRYLIPRITLKNIGQSKVKLIQKGSGYRIWMIQEGGRELRELGSSDSGVVYGMFEEHQWIEPGESIFDENRMFSLPGDCIAVKIQARLVAQVRRLPSKNSEWNCSAILGPVSTSDPSNKK